ncbi:hypothetical protein BASA81_002655 [Batrachochytrium salamandrivorans]|nr:hypothetical protein BASA81_002655 [Batrachochytrium salamandrivorans]
MSAFDRAVSLGREAEGAAPQDSQRLHGEAHAAFKQLLRETTDLGFKRELRVLIDYHAKRKSAPLSAPPSFSSVAVSTPRSSSTGLYSPLTHKPPPVLPLPPPPRTLLSVLVACEEMQRFEEEFINLVPRPPPPFPVRPEPDGNGEDNEDGFYEVSKLDLSSKHRAAQPAPLPSRETQQARNRMQYYMTMEREQLKRKTEEYWTLAGIVRIASQELDKALAKQQVEVNLLQEKIKEERLHRQIAEAKLAELHRAYPASSSSSSTATVSSFGV